MSSCIHSALRKRFFRLLVFMRRNEVKLKVFRPRLENDGHRTESFKNIYTSYRARQAYRGNDSTSTILPLASDLSYKLRTRVIAFVSPPCRVILYLLFLYGKAGLSGLSVVSSRIVNVQFYLHSVKSSQIQE